MEATLENGPTPQVALPDGGPDWYTTLQDQQFARKAAERKFSSPKITATIDSGFVDDDDMDVLREHLVSSPGYYRPSTTQKGAPSASAGSGKLGPGFDIFESQTSSLSPSPSRPPQKTQQSAAVQTLRNAKEVAAIAALARFRVTAQERMAVSKHNDGSKSRSMSVSTPNRFTSLPQIQTKNQGEEADAEAAAYQANVKATTKAFQGASIKQSAAGLAAELAQFRENRAVQVREPFHGERPASGDGLAAATTAHAARRIQPVATATAVLYPQMALAAREGDGADDGNDGLSRHNTAAIELAHFAAPQRETPPPTLELKQIAAQRPPVQLVRITLQCCARLRGASSHHSESCAG